MTWSWGTYSTSLKGPVPIALIFRFSRSASPFGMIPDARMPANEPSSGYGASRFIWIVRGSRIFISLIESSQFRHGEAVLGSRIRSTLYLTSSAVSGWPLWNFTLGRRWKV